MTKSFAHTYEVDPGRLQLGEWSHEFNETVGEGDIAAAYCADTIALHQKARKPFVFRGDLYITTGRSGCGSRGTSGGGGAECYRLVLMDDWAEDFAQFEDKARDAAAARNDLRGFYHGVGVKYGPDWFVLDGPPVRFVPGQVQQPGLFGDLAL